MANIWREPIFDRTSSDVGNAIRKIAEWKENHTHWADIAIDYEKVTINEGEVTTTPDSIILEHDGVVYVEDEALVVRLGVVYDLKGCLNLSDITRIEDNIQYLSSKLTESLYPVTVSCKEWVRDDLPNVQDMKRIADNIRAIFRDFYTPSGAMDIPDIMLSYADINALEYNLHLLKETLDSMEKSFIQSGAYICGATNRLPIRR